MGHIESTFAPNRGLYFFENSNGSSRGFYAVVSSISGPQDIRAAEMFALRDLGPAEKFEINPAQSFTTTEGIEISVSSFLTPEGLTVPIFSAFPEDWGARKVDGIEYLVHRGDTLTLPATGSSERCDIEVSQVSGREANRRFNLKVNYEGEKRFTIRKTRATPIAPGVMAKTGERVSREDGDGYLYISCHPRYFKYF